MTISRTSRHALTILFGAVAQLCFAFVASESVNRAFENSHPGWFERTEALWVTLMLIGPGVIVGFLALRNAFSFGVLACAIGWLAGFAYEIHALHRTGIKPPISEMVPVLFALCAGGGVSAQVTSLMMRKWSSNKRLERP